MKEIHSKAEYARKMRDQFDHTWSQLAPRLTVYGLIDETVGQIVKKRASDRLASTLAIAGTAWLFNRFQRNGNVFKFSKSKTATLKQENKNHESSNTIGRNS